MKKKLIIHVDGASSGNPGPSGIGIVIKDEKHAVVKKISLPIGNATNNIAEYTAMAYALSEAAREGASSVALRTDSELLAKQLQGLYKIKDKTLKSLHEQICALQRKIKHVDIMHVPREDNREADTLAKKAVRANNGTSSNHLSPTHIIDRTQMTFGF